MRILLDLDGVMVPIHPKKKVEFELDGVSKFSEKAVEKLNEIIAEHKDYCEIVLTTSHRFHGDELWWWWLLGRRGISDVDAISRIETPLTFEGSRKDLILNWIDEYGYSPEEILILDDDKSLNGLPQEWKERLILCDPMLGLV